MPSTVLLDACGRRRSPATLPSFHHGRPPRNKGQRSPADPPTVEEIIAVLHAAGEDHDAVRLRGLVVVLWRAGLRISEALALTESDLDVGRGAILVRRGKGGKRREVGMDRWAWEQLVPWLQLRTTLPVGALFCVLRGPRPPVARGRPLGCAHNWITQPLEPACVVGSRPTSPGTPMRWRCRARECRCWSFSVNSGTPTSRSPRSTYAGSTTPRSCMPSTSAPLR
jgi:integrase